MTHIKIVSKFVIISLVLLGSIASKAEILTISGVYQGKNLYVQNPFAGNMRDYCTNDVYVNEEKKEYNVASSAFEIDLSFMKIGDPVTVKITHKSDCKPKVLNPEVLSPKSTFKITKINIDRSGLIQWSTTGETGKLPFTVEQYRWKKWQSVGTVNGSGTAGESNYTLPVSIHTGINQFRVKQSDNTNKPRYSPEVTFRNLAAPVSFQPGDGKKASNEITFSDKTKYEIYDFYGKPVTKGDDIKIDVSKLKAGNYFLNYDNQSATFIKK